MCVDSHNKIYYKFLLFFIALLLNGCGSGEPDKSDEEQDPDTSPPNVVITSATNVIEMPYLLRGTFDDDVAVTSLYYQIGSTPIVDITPLTSPFSVELNLDEGSYLITVTAEDDAGNVSSAEITLNYLAENSLPKGEITSLLSEAVVNGDISQQQALLYEVYALFGDDRLPLQYRGDNSTGELDHALDELASQYDTLSEETRAALDPYLVPPYYTGSWWEQRTTAGINAKLGKPMARENPPCSPRDDCNLNTNKWDYVDTGNGKVRVWYVTTDANAASHVQKIVSEIDSTIWPKLKTLMSGHEPIADTYDFNNGGDGRLDISLLNFKDPNLSAEFPFGGNTYGFVQNYPPGCEKDSVYIVVNSAKSLDAMLATVVHETMHAFQWSYDVAATCLNRAEDYKWLMEATATWAIDYVYPDNDLEQQHASLNFLPVPNLSLDDLSGNHEYGAYLFPFYLARSFAPVWIRYIWDATESEDKLGVLKKGIQEASGGQTSLEQQWPKFTVSNWNRDPIDDYKNWDKLNSGAQVMNTLLDPQPADLKGAEEDQIDMAVRVPHLASQYAHITFPDNSVRSVMFYNGYSFKVTEQNVDFPINSKAFISEPLSDTDKKGAHLWAIVKSGGSWQDPEDWTDQQFKVYCRDSVAERIEELVLIYSNSDIDDKNRNIEPKGVNPFVRYNNAGCWQWKGNVDLTDEDDGVTSKLKVSATWEKTNPMVFPKSSNAKALTGITYQLTQGTLEWNISGTDSAGCIYSGSVNQNISSSVPGVSSGTLQTYNFVSAGEARRGFVLTGFTNNNMPIMTMITKVCPDGSDTSYEPIYPMLTVTPEKAHAKFDTTGTIISGNGDDAQGGTAVSGSWSFSAQRQP